MQKLEWSLEPQEIKEMNKRIVWLIIIICLLFFVVLSITNKIALPIYIGLGGCILIYVFSLVYRPIRRYKYILDEHGITYIHRYERFYPWSDLRGYCLHDSLEFFISGSLGAFFSFLSGNIFSRVTNKTGQAFVIFTKASKFIVYIDPQEVDFEEVRLFLSKYLKEVDLEGHPL